MEALEMKTCRKWVLVILWILKNNQVLRFFFIRSLKFRNLEIFKLFTSKYYGL
jgi:hypothetical protein